MASKVAKAASGGIRAWLMPEIIEIKGELKTVNVRIDGLNTRIDDMDKRLTTKIDALDNRLTGEIQGLKESLNVVQRRSP